MTQFMNVLLAYSLLIVFIELCISHSLSEISDYIDGTLEIDTDGLDNFITDSELNYNYDYLEDLDVDKTRPSCTETNKTNKGTDQSSGYQRLFGQQKQKQQNYAKQQQETGPMDDDCVAQFGWPCKYQKTCGYAPMNNARGYLITGGDNASPGQWPFYAALYYNNTYRCGGSIASEHHIITAKHCVTEIAAQEQVDNLLVIMGTHMHLHYSDDSFWRTKERNAQFHRIKWVIRDPNADLAWLYSQKAFKFNNHVQPVCYVYDHNLDRRVQFKEPEKCYLVGGGLDQNQTGVIRRPIKYMEATELPNCTVDVGKYTHCYQPMYDGDLSGKGDSGSPIVCLDQSANRWQLVGAHKGKKEGAHMLSPTDTSFAKLSSNLPPIYSRDCKMTPAGSTICKAQAQCNLPPGSRPRPSQPYLVRIDKVSHDSMRDGGDPCPGVLVSYNLVLTERNCTLVRYYKGNVLDIAPLDSLQITMGIYETSPGAIKAEVNGGDEIDNLRLRVDEIYLLRKFNRDLIMLRLDRDLYRNRVLLSIDKHPICWPYKRDIIDWNRCKIVRFVQPKYSVEYQVGNVPCPVGGMKDVPIDIFSCWEPVSLLQSNTQLRDIWIAGSPVVCTDNYDGNFLVAIVKSSNKTLALAANILGDDLKIAHWTPEIIRSSQPKSTEEF